MIRKQFWFPIVYMFCVTAFFSSIVIGLTRFTSERVETNEKLAFERAVLSVLPEIEVEKMTRSEIHSTFVQSISEPDESSTGAYTAKRNGQVTAYVLPLSGQGFWAPIKLGAEIAKAPFKNQFRGKVISSQDKPIDIRRPGMVLGDNEVHAVTGATQTSSRLEIIINNALTQWRDQAAK
jgi:Na+-transporting NADH:ubiquinone oxidoreductase subunit NqrC